MVETSELWPARRKPPRFGSLSSGQVQRISRALHSVLNSQTISYGLSGNESDRGVNLMIKRHAALGILSILFVLSGPHSLWADDHAYVETDLVSDIPGRAASVDANLVNPWGIVASSTSPFWVSDNGSGLSTLYNGAGTSWAWSLPFRHRRERLVRLRLPESSSIQRLRISRSPRAGIPAKPLSSLRLRMERSPGGAPQ